MKKCSKCKEQKPRDEFHNNRSMKDGKEYWCKPCRRTYDILKWHNTPKEIRLKRNREWKKQNPERVKLNRWKNNLRVYGLTIEEYEAIKEEQNGLCAICKNPPSGKGPYGKLHVDHNHTTGEIRGLLCSPCNKAIGIFKENINYLESAIKYLEKHESRNS